MLAAGTKDIVDYSDNDELLGLLSLVINGNPMLFKDIKPKIPKISLREAREAVSPCFRSENLRQCLS